MKTKKVEIFQDGVYKAHLGSNKSWWFDPQFEHSFSIFNLDGFYQDDYFEYDHLPKDMVERCVDYIFEYGKKFLNREVTSILELGCGGGWFTEEFMKRGVDIVAVEGSLSGYQKTIARGIPEERVIRHDLRLPIDLGRTFDMVVCTEVAEHIEPPFSSQLISNIVKHSQVIWFSFEDPYATDLAIYVHPNEQPEIFWKNIFEFFGYKIARIPESVKSKIDDRGSHICYSKDLPVSAELNVELIQEQMDEISLSLGKEVVREMDSNARIFIKKLLPPILLEGYTIIKKSLRKN